MRITDEVLNIGGRHETVSMLYHMNFGFPIVGSGTTVSLNDDPLLGPLHDVGFRNECEGDDDPGKNIAATIGEPLACAGRAKQNRMGSARRSACLATTADRYQSFDRRA